MGKNQAFVYLQRSRGNEVILQNDRKQDSV